MTISVPSFVHLTVVAGKVVEVQIRVNRLGDVILCSDVTTGAEEKGNDMQLTSLKYRCCAQAYNYSQSWG